jgi:hypothetical protein
MAGALSCLFIPVKGNSYSEDFEKSSHDMEILSKIGTQHRHNISFKHLETKIYWHENKTEERYYVDIWEGQPREHYICNKIFHSRKGVVKYVKFYIDNVSYDPFEIQISRIRYRFIKAR